MTSNERATGSVPQSRLPILSLTALGIVFGDIGTSPLYTFKTILNMTAKTPDPSIILGALSLVLWTLLIVTTVKYVSFAMRFDNDGEGHPGSHGFAGGEEAAAAEHRGRWALRCRADLR